MEILDKVKLTPDLFNQTCTGKKKLTSSFYNEQGTGEVDKFQLNTYLRSKQIKPGKQHQLNLIFPSIENRKDLRHIPNDFARSSLFTVSNKNQARRMLTREKLFHYNEYITLLFTGIELRAEDDEIVFLQILSYGQNVALGDPFEFSINNLVRDVGWAKNGRNYDRARECISRLKANEVLALNSKAYGNSGAVSLIQNYTAVNDEKSRPTQYRVWIDPKMIVLFAGNTFTSHKWASYRILSPVARRLTDYIESHKFPFPLGIERFRKMCGSVDSNKTSWRQTVRKASADVQNAMNSSRVFLDDNDQICVDKTGCDRKS